MSKYIVSFGTAVKAVIAEGKNKAEITADAWDKYDEARDQEPDEIIIKSIKKITK